MGESTKGFSSCCRKNSLFASHFGTLLGVLKFCSMKPLQKLVFFKRFLEMSVRIFKQDEIRLFQGRAYQRTLKLQQKNLLLIKLMLYFKPKKSCFVEKCGEKTSF